jgi:ATP-dependent Clp protease ATP-binding subunit ClpB
VIADLGFDPQFGARPVKRAIQKYVLNDLSKQLISGKVHNDQTIIVDADETGLVFTEK